MTSRFLAMILGAACAGFVAGTLQGFEAFVSLNIRWILLAVLMLALFLTPRFYSGLRNAFGVALIFYVCWCFLTILWSDELTLSLSKVIALAIVAPSFIGAGALVAKKQSLDKAFNFALLLSLLAVLACFGSADPALGPVDESLFSGRISSPNMFGILHAMAIPLALWRQHIHRKQILIRSVWLALIALHLTMIYYSGSRGALLVSLSTISFYVVALGVKWVLLAGTSGLVVSLAAMFFAPSVVEHLQERLIYKGASTDQGIFYSRDDPWRESLAAAHRGGWIGGGYGVSVGATGFTGGLSTLGYGREKGNSQLAVMEETGIVGLIFYILLHLCLMLTLLQGYFTSDRLLRVAHCIATGVVFGMFFNSVFEGWWVAPGSPEFPYFCTMCGVSIGLAQLAARQRVRARRTQPISSQSRAQT